MKITIYEIHDPNEDGTYLPEIEGYRYMIDYNSITITSNRTFANKVYCIISVRRTIKRLCIQLPKKFTMSEARMYNSEFIV
jgi:hypothetical protein